MGPGSFIMLSLFAMVVLGGIAFLSTLVMRKWGRNTRVGETTAWREELSDNIEIVDFNSDIRGIRRSEPYPVGAKIQKIKWSPFGRLSMMSSNIYEIEAPVWAILPPRPLNSLCESGRMVQYILPHKETHRTEWDNKFIARIDTLELTNKKEKNALLEAYRLLAIQKNPGAALAELEKYAVGMNRLHKRGPSRLGPTEPEIKLTTGGGGPGETNQQEEPPQ